MKQSPDQVLTRNQQDAIAELRRRLPQELAIEKIVLFGSVARGEADEESDLDLLILTRRLLPRLARHRITDMIFDVNLEYGTNLSSLVIDRDAWESGPISVLSIHDEILRDGIPV